MNLTLHYSERVYTALLSLYPVRFRVRFAPEMLQLFRDCCHDALEKGEVAVLAAFWLRAMRDLFLSIIRERQREVLGPLNSEHPLMGFVDLTLIPSIVVVNLIVLGPVLTLLVKGGFQGSTEQFAVTSGFFSIAIDCLTVLASVLISMLRPKARLWVKLS